MKLFFKKHRIAAALIIYFLVIAGVLFFAIKPIAREIKLKADKIQETLTLRENKTKRLEELPKLKEQYEMALNEEEKLILPLEKDKAVELIEKIEKLAQDSGSEITIEVKDVTADSAAAAGKSSSGGENEKKSLRSDLPGSDYLEMKIGLRGDYNGLVKFAEKMETMEYYGDVVSLGIFSGNASAGQLKTGFTFSIVPAAGEATAEGASEENKLNSVIDTVFYVKSDK